MQPSMLPPEAATIVGAAATPGHALTFAHNRMIRGGQRRSVGGRGLPSSQWQQSPWVAGTLLLKGRSGNWGLPSPVPPATFGAA